jgi:hypothetical protein
MARFKIENISRNNTIWQEFCDVVLNEGLPPDALKDVEYNSENIIKLLSDSKSLLVFGQVQSGKTLNYCGLIAKIFERNVKLVVVLAGTKTNLVEQTYSRLNGYFKNAATVDVVKLTKGYNIKQLIDGIVVKENRKAIVVCLKHQVYLNEIGLALHYNATNTIVIDDEADQASLNTKEYYSAQNNSQDMSRIYSELRSILTLNAVKLVQYTATPQALFLLSGDNSLAPDKYYVQIPPESYFGIHELIENRNKHLIRIDNFDTSYRRILDQFIKQCYLLLSRHNYDLNISCLVHSDWRTDSLARDFEKVRNFCDDYLFDSKDWKVLETGSMSVSDFENWFRGNIIVYDIFKSKSLVEWDKHQFVILVGGNMLERGYTIPGLISTILTRNSLGISNSDTLQQRCRFLGYRGILKDYIRVYSTEEIINDLMDYDRSQSILLEEINESGKTVDFSQVFVMKYLLPTRQSVLSGSLMRSIGGKNIIIRRKVLSFDFINEYILKGYLRSGELTVVNGDLLKKLLNTVQLSAHYIKDEMVKIVLFGSPISPRKRSFDSFGKVKELFQGRSGQYLGDRYLFPGEYHLQVHLVIDSNRLEKYFYLVIMNGDKMELVYLN